MSTRPGPNFPLVVVDLLVDDALTPNNKQYEDDTYVLLRQHFLRPPGRGRPKTLPSSIPLTHRLLVQLYYLKGEDDQCTFTDLQEWLCKLIPTVASVTKSRITHHVTSTYKSCQQMKEGSVVPFLDKKFDFHALPPSLSFLGLNRLSLIDVDSFTLSSENQLLVPITNDVVRALEHFQVQENLPLSFVMKWIKKIDSTCSMTDSQLRSKILSVCKKIRAFVKNKKNVELKHFLNQPFHSGLHLASSTPPLCIDLGTPKEVKQLKKTNEVLKTKICEKGVQIAVLKEECGDLRQTNEGLDHLEGQLSEKTKENRILIAQLKEKESQVSKIAQSRTYKLNASLRTENKEAVEKIDVINKQNEEAVEKIDVLNKQNEDLKDELVKVKHNLKLAQTGKRNFMKKFEIEKEKNHALAEEVNLIDDEVDTSLKCENSNKYKESVRLAYMDLQGKAEVAASKCSQVVQIVSKHFFGQDLTLKELPSCSTALNFADEAHHISMHQVVDKIRTSEHYTYASDGTSRQKKQYLERHIILADKTQLSIGFTEIATDDAKTLMEQTIEMLHELSNIYCSDDESKDRDIFKDLICKMKCLMSDRAAVNKLFNKKMSEYRKEYLGDDSTTTHFLYCNAHFLLGLARATEKAVKEIEEELCSNGEGRLGRDKQAKFASFSTSTEAAACRLIRTVSECLGPRCDEKSGSWAEWMAYCDEHNIVSKFTSYRSNRFNNIFENAVATIFHHQHFTDFLTKYCNNLNLKLQSVVADADDDKVLSIVGAIALFNFVITESYWKLMNSFVPYGEFPQYVRKLESVLDRLSSHGIEQSDEARSVFEDYPVTDDAIKILLFSGSSPCKKEIWMPAFKQIAQKCHMVLKRQLSDFLDEGIFGGQLDSDTQNILNTCPLTNLSGERLFGDMDYDMLRRRHSTTHHRSTVTMWKHNKTAEWLEGQSKVNRTKIMDAAVKNRTKLRKKHLESVRLARETIKAKLSENEQKLKEKDIKDSTMKASILDGIIAHGGVCKTKKELEELYKNCTIDGLKVQIRYRKVFMNQKHLKLTGTKKTLFSNLLDEIVREEGSNNESGDGSIGSSSESECVGDLCI